MLQFMNKIMRVGGSVFGCLVIIHDPWILSASLSRDPRYEEIYIPFVYVPC